VLWHRGARSKTGLSVVKEGETNKRKVKGDVDGKALALGCQKQNRIVNNESGETL
jgi:hypothetical protein